MEGCSGGGVQWWRSAVVERCSGGEVQWWRGAVVEECSGREVQCSPGFPEKGFKHIQLSSCECGSLSPLLPGALS